MRLKINSLLCCMVLCQSVFSLEVKCPNLSGTWKGTCTSAGTSYSDDLTIEQNECQQISLEVPGLVAKTTYEIGKINQSNSSIQNGFTSTIRSNYWQNSSGVLFLTAVTNNFFRDDAQEFSILSHEQMIYSFRIENGRLITKFQAESSGMQVLPTTKADNTIKTNTECTYERIK